jgi:LysM repeat protein
MRPTLILCCLLTAGAIALAGCGRDAPGVIITENGTVVANSAEYQRGRIASAARRQLDDQLGGHWLSAVEIAELPEWDNDQRSMGREWLWPQATVTVTLVGDGTAPLPESADAVRDAVTGYMRGHVDRPGKNLTVTVATVTDAARFATLSGAPRTTAATPTFTTAAPAPAGPRTYTVQRDDTLAMISTVFYGSPQYWKAILAANPGLAPEELRIGMVLVIPPKPAP